MINHLEDYLHYLLDTKHISLNTYSSYRRDLKKLIRYLEEKGYTDFAKITVTTIEDYIAFLQSCDYASTTITRSFIAVKSFCRYLCAQGILLSNPADSVKLPKAVGKPNAVLSKEEMRKLLDSPVEYSFKGLRDRSMLLLLYDTKISISDLVSLKVASVDFDNHILFVRKDSVVKEYRLCEDVMEALRIYVDYKKLESTDWLFPNRYGNPMSRQGFWKTIKNYSRDMGIEKDITLYSIKQGEI